MNKVFFILLAVCLVGTLVQGEEKKEVNSFEQVQKELDLLGKQISDKLSESINPEQIKKSFNEAVDKVNKAITELKAKSEAGKQ